MAEYGRIQINNLNLHFATLETIQSRERVGEMRLFDTGPLCDWMSGK